MLLGWYSREIDLNRCLVRVFNWEFEFLKLKMDVLEKLNLLDDMELEDIDRFIKELLE